MKKHRLFVAASLCLSFLAGCGGNSNGGLPETKFEKVQYALNGVEKSLKNQKSAKKNALRLSPRERRNETEALDAIYGFFPDGVAGEPDFKYDEPPMIQFQYIKKTLEKIGTGFDFGVKYQETITGQIYYDFSTGKETNTADFKQNYSLDFSLYINIDDSDLITCKTLFDVNYTHENDVHHQSMYAEMSLTYDLKKTDANYKLKMFAVDDCSDFNVPEEKYFSAELDYVDVSADAIKEWGKLGYSANKAIALDQAHPSFASYLSEGGLAYKPTIQLYRNGKRYQRNQLDDEKANQAITIVCDDLGVNGTDIKYKDYIKQSAAPQPVLKTCYQEFSNIYGRDLLYNIVYTGAKEDSHGGGEGEQERLDPSWPTQDLIDDGYEDVPGFLSKTATFRVTRGYSSDTDSYSYLITVINPQSDDFSRYQGSLVASGFVETKVETACAYLHSDSEGKTDYAVMLLSSNNAGLDMIAIGKVVDQEEHENIAIQNGNDYAGDYSSYEEHSYRDSAQIASIVERISGGQVSASAVAPYVIPGSSKTYEIKLDQNEFTSDDLNRNYGEYAKSYSGWKTIAENGAFYKTLSGIDVLILLEKDSAKGTIIVHSFAFAEGSIEAILSGGQQGGGDSSQPIMKVTVYLYEVDSQKGVPEFVGSYEFDEGQTINIGNSFGPGKYFEDPGCVIPLADEIIARDGLSIYRRVDSDVQTEGKIIVMDANTKQELFAYTDAIDAKVKGGQIFDFVLYHDSSCGNMVGLDEEITIGAEPITLYCKDCSSIDYVTLTVNTYINGILSPYRIREFGVRRGKIMNNYSSNSFPTYYSDASYFDSEFTMSLNGAELKGYSQDLLAFVDNAVLNIYCENDWCKVYHIGQGQEGFDIVWEDGGLNEGDVVLHGSRFYTISAVNGSNADYNETTTAYTYSLCSVYNGKVITTQKDYFAVSGGQGMSFMIDPDAEPYFFLDVGLENPLMPKEGQSEVMFTNSFTLYVPFTR